jgi:hypothetical protein
MDVGMRSSKVDTAWAATVRNIRQSEQFSLMGKMPLIAPMQGHPIVSAG